MFELLSDVLQRVDHDAGVIEPLFGDGTAEERLEAQVLRGVANHPNHPNQTNQRGKSPESEGQRV